MYQPPHHREDRLAVQHELIRAHPLGLLITAGPGGLLANPVPFLMDSERGEYGTLRAHVRAPIRNGASSAQSANASSSSKARRNISRRPGMRRSATPARWCRPGITRPCMPGENRAPSKMRRGCASRSVS